ncbi:peptide chain release factor H [Sphingobacterium spiritivorum]|uniref:peptide chain release factor H n=1 Tax=Sphingobacterium spiritivorum TaxID=258 RepID=UPI003DA489F4
MDIIIGITAGRGPQECSWVVAQVIKKIIQEAAAFDVEVQVLNRQEGDINGTVISASLQISGEQCVAFAALWTGTIQWIGKSDFRKSHKRKNWFIEVFEIKSSASWIFDEKDIRYQTMRSSGAGGQHVNKVSSAVRATHIPTGVSVVAMDSRSQHQNKKIATERLQTKVNELNLLHWKEDEKYNWFNQIQVERGNAIRTFIGTDFKSEKVDKSYKAKRKVQKQRFRQEIKIEKYNNESN